MRQDPTVLMFWMIWFAMLSGVILIGVFIPWIKESQVASPMSYLLLLPGITSVLIRLMVLNRDLAIQKKLVVFVIGVAAGEGCALLGKFLLGASDAYVQFGFGIACIISYCPALLKSQKRSF